MLRQLKFTPRGGRVTLSAALCEPPDAFDIAAAAEAAHEGAPVELGAPPGCEAPRSPRRAARVSVDSACSASSASDPPTTPVAAAPPPPHWVRIVVADTGCGVAPRAQPRLFAPFAQAVAADGGRPAGNGLGLALVQRIARHLGGHAALASSGVPGEGAAVTLTLPFAPDGSEEAPPLPRHARRRSSLDTAAAAALVPPLQAAERPAEPAQPLLPSPRVLLADDNATNVRVACAVLARCGVAPPAVAGDGAQALAAFLAAPADEPFQVILMDVSMPVMGGVEACRRIRAAEAARGTPPEARVWVVALTANTAAEDRAECEAAQMDDFVAKPFHPQALRALLRRWARACGAPGAGHGAGEEGVPHRSFSWRAAAAAVQAARRAAAEADAAEAAPAAAPADGEMAPNVPQ